MGRDTAPRSLTMRKADVPPGRKLMVLSSAGHIEAGDVLYEQGPRLGERYWRVEFIEHARKYWHAVVAPIPESQWIEVVVACMNVASPGAMYHMRRNT